MVDMFHCLCHILSSCVLIWIDIVVFYQVDIVQVVMEIIELDNNDDAHDLISPYGYNDATN
jgi:hypothetical protein